MTYIIVEIQTDASGTVTFLTFKKDGTDAAEQQYHTSLAAAAVSALPCHAVSMLDSEGRLIKREKYTHKPEEDQQDEQTNQND